MAKTPKSPIFWGFRQFGFVTMLSRQREGLEKASESAGFRGFGVREIGLFGHLDEIRRKFEIHHGLETFG